MLKESQNNIVNKYLINHRKLELKLELNYDTITIDSYKCKYLVTHYHNNQIEYQTIIETWSEACSKFNKLFYDVVNNMDLFEEE